MEIKGNEINRKVWKKYQKTLESNISFISVYSEDELIADDEEDEEPDDELESIGKQIESIKLNN